MLMNSSLSHREIFKKWEHLSIEAGKKILYYESA